MKYIRLLLGVVIFTGIISCGSLSQTETEGPEVVITSVQPAVTNKIFASAGSTGDQFGHSVSISGSGTVIACGAHGDSTVGTASGAGYIYTLQNGVWSETKIVDEVGAASDYFGYDIALSEDGKTFVAGAYGSDINGSGSGAVFIYRYQNGVWQKTPFQSSLTEDGDKLGLSVTVSGDGNIIVAGMPGDDENGSSAGALVVLGWDGSRWIETKLVPEVGLGADDMLADSVSISRDGTTIVAGFIRDDPKGTSSGGAYIYEWTGDRWNPWEMTRLIPSDGAAGDLFGRSVDVSGDGSVVVVGAEHHTDVATSSGAVYVYTKVDGVWEPFQLLAPDRQANDDFGYSVAVSSDGSTIAVGAYKDDDAATDTGSVYIYKRQSNLWIPWELCKIVPADPAGNDRFGASVDLNADGSKLVVASLYGDGFNSSSGCAYYFSWDGTDWE